MSRNSGTLFKKSLFGYKKADVNEYIRQADEKHSNELLQLKLERDALEERLTQNETRISELEGTLEVERAAAKEAIRKLSAESERKLGEAKKLETAIQAKLNESEARATAYLKLADSSSMRAESAETESSILSASLEAARAEIKALKNELSEKKEESKRLAELEALTRSYALQKQDDDQVRSQRQKYFMIRKPSIGWLKGKK